jgi:inner membrane transporter RhtA
MSRAKQLRSSIVPPIPAVILSVVSVQGGAIFAKGIFSAVGPTGAAGMRIGLSAIMLLVAFRPALGALTRTQWSAVIPYGLALGAMNLSFYMALDRIPLGLAVTLEFAGPLTLAVFGSRRILDFAWVVLAGVGIALITPWQRSDRAVDLYGVLLALVAGALWAAYIVLGRRASKVLPPGQSVATGMLFACFTILPFSFGAGLAENLTPWLFAQGLAVALLSSAVPFTLEMMALRVLPARTFGILMSLEPAVAALCGLVFLKEQLTLTQWVALIFVSVASTGTTLTARNLSHPVDA